MSIATTSTFGGRLPHSCLFIDIRGGAICRPRASAVTHKRRRNFIVVAASSASSPPPPLVTEQQHPPPAADATDTTTTTRGGVSSLSSLPLPPQPKKRKRKRKNRPPRTGPAERESFELLGWQDLCRQVACFCDTSQAAQQVMRGRLPIGKTIEDSRRLLQQTKEAATIEMSFQGIYYLQRALETAAAGQQVLHPLVLGAVSTTVLAACRLGEVVESGGEGTAALQQLAGGMKDALPLLQPLIDEIEKCIQIKEGRVKDTASPLLASTRASRQDNIAILRRTADEWARELHDTGAAERPQVVIRRDRLCIPVRAGRQSDLPRGSVVLATSSTGSTVYMEPAALVPLNNAEAALGAAEREEEDRILRELAAAVAAGEKEIKAVLAAATALDIAAARAKHAKWMGGVEPILTDTLLSAQNNDNNSENIQNNSSLVCISGALHPILMEPLLPTLSKPRLPEITFTSSVTDPNSSSLAGVNLVPELWTAITAEAAAAVSAVPPPRRRPRQTREQKQNTNESGENASSSASSLSTSNNSSSDDDGGSDEATPHDALSSLVPIDLLIPTGKTVVAVTGPNTGGKTASLKALGLLSLMAKSGLFLPIKRPPSTTTTTLSLPTEEEDPPPVIPWFDRILADVGDGQNLQQSLSTFSGHVRRLRGVLQECTPCSLILLDEVGSGTDPGEGAALAAALLLRLADGRAALTYATTHHAELKEVASTHPAFINASVEFDIESLKPTYRLLWGTSGDSNALAVAEGLGFDPLVVQDAREVASQLADGENSAAVRAAALHASLREQAAAAQVAAVEAARRRAVVEAELKAVQEELKTQQTEHAAAISKKATSKSNSKQKKEEGDAGGDGGIDITQNNIRKVLSDVRNAKITPEAGEKELRRIERRLNSSDSAAMTLTGLKWGSSSGSGGGSGSEEESNALAIAQQQRQAEGWIPQPGEFVQVLKMGGAIGTVTNDNCGGGGKISVRIGALTMQVRVTDVAPSSTAPAPVTSTGKYAGGRRIKATGMLSSSSSSSSIENAKNRSASAATVGSILGVAVQTSRNTVDVRGLVPDDAVAAVEIALNDARPGSVVFAVHGVGTGRVRAAVLDAARRHPTMVKMEEAEASNGGCTVIYLK